MRRERERMNGEFARESVERVMHLAFVTMHDPNDPSHWAGTTYHMAQALERQSIKLSRIGPLVERGRTWLKVRQLISEKLTGQAMHRDREPGVLEGYAEQVSAKLRALPEPVDAIFTNSTIPIARLATDRPIAFWADATYGGIVKEYVWERPASARSKRLGDAQERDGIARSALAIYSSDWAARSAIEHYGADPANVHVVPFGANIDESRTTEDVAKLIDARPDDRCSLLYIGTGWKRKGGDIAIDVARLCNELGLPTQLTLLGSDVPAAATLPSFARAEGFVRKDTPAGRVHFDALFGESHFFLLPARAEAFGIVLCEANSYGVPCITTRVGGIPTIVHDGVNGHLFAPEQPREMAQRIVELMRHRERYRARAMRSFEEYRGRLNWSAAGRSVKSLLEARVVQR